MTEQLNQFDLAFVVDTTASMGGFIAAAQRQMVAIMRELSRAADVRMRVGVVEYRDHPPQDRMVFRVHAMSDDLSEAERQIRGLSAGGGGDAPEAVLDGVRAACLELDWRPHARRLAVLVGDAPPHGTGAPGDSFAKGCPCGETIESVTATAEDRRVTLYALGLQNAVAESFTRLASFTGGAYFAARRADGAVERIKQILADEFGHLDLDAAVLAEWTARRDAGDFSTDETAERLGSTPGAVAAAVARLASRQLLSPARPIERVLAAATSE